jgi:hypothetical protein
LRASVLLLLEPTSPLVLRLLLEPSTSVLSGCSSSILLLLLRESAPSVLRRCTAELLLRKAAVLLRWTAEHIRIRANRLRRLGRSHVSEKVEQIVAVLLLLLLLLDLRRSRPAHIEIQKLIKPAPRRRRPGLGLCRAGAARKRAPTAGSLRGRSREKIDLGLWGRRLLRRRGRRCLGSGRGRSSSRPTRIPALLLIFGRQKGAAFVIVGVQGKWHFTRGPFSHPNAIDVVIRLLLEGVDLFLGECGH